MASTAAANQAIFNRLSGMSRFHPATANLFADWTLDPGDVVTVRQGQTDYTVPIYQMNLDWRGKPMVEVQSTGSEKRPPLSALKRNSYGSGKRQEEQEQELIRHRADIETNNERILLWATEEEWDEISEEYVETGRSQFEVTSAAITSEVSRAMGAEGTLSSRITQEADRISLVVTGTGANAQVNRAGIVLAINGGTGHSTAVIEADQIDINGIVTALAAKNISVLDLSAEAINADSIDVGAGGFTVDNQGSINGGDATLTDVTCDNLTVGSEDINVADVQPNGNTLIITYVDGTTATFSRASASRTVRTLTQSGGTVNVGSKVYTVDADIVYTDGSTGSSTIAIPFSVGSYDTSTGNYPITVAGISGLSVNAEDAYISGYENAKTVVSINSITAGQVTASGSALTIPVTVEIGDGYQTWSTASGSATANADSLLQSKSVSSNGTVTPDSGYIGLSSVTVSGVRNTEHRQCVDNLTFKAGSASLTTQPTHMYALVQGRYEDMGSGYWYMRNTYMQVKTMYT